MAYERPNIAAMQGYAYGEQPEQGGVVKLNTNENPYPPSPAVARALSNIDVGALRTYPDALATPLRQAVAKLHEVTPDQVVMTNGGDEALRLALTTFVEPGAGFGMAEPSYSLYPVLAAIQDATVHRISLDANWNLPASAGEEFNQAGVQLTAVVNPHAPSGTLAPVRELAQLAQELTGVLLIDEAYADFVDPSLDYNAVDLINQHDNILILRTFSKGYSLAGLRLGYFLGSRGLIQTITDKTRDSYNVDHLSQAVGSAAIGDQRYAEQTWSKVRSDRQALVVGLSQLGLSAPESQSNFVLAQIPTSAKLNAPQLYEALKAQKIFVRYFDAPRLQDRLRITIGTNEENQIFLAALGELLI